MLDFQNEINRCLSVVKWNPMSAIKDMEMLRIESQESEIKQSIWDSAAIQINKTIDSIEKAPYYVKKEYWGQHQPTKLEVF
jgi:hypothetical protein